MLSRLSENFRLLILLKNLALETYGIDLLEEAFSLFPLYTVMPKSHFESTDNLLDTFKAMDF